MIILNFVCLSGRWDEMGAELFRLKDRHGIEYCLGPVSSCVNRLPVG